MDHGKSDLSTSPTMTERAVRRKRSWRTKRWERKAGTENDNEKTATSRPRARQRRRQSNDQDNGDAGATKITSNNVTIPYLRIKCTTTKQNICHRQSVGSIHSNIWASLYFLLCNFLVSEAKIMVWSQRPMKENPKKRPSVPLSSATWYY